MDLRNVQCFVTAARLGNFTHAAKQMFISQSALSQSVRRLEAELGVALFERKNNTVALTPAGEIFLPEAERLLSRAELLKTHMAEFSKENTETLNFGISTFYSLYFLPAIINFAGSFRPRIRINGIEDSSHRLEEMVAGGILDCCVCPQPIDHTDLQVTPMRKETIWLAFPPEHPLLREYAEDIPVPVSLLADESFIFVKKVHRFAAFAMQLCTEAGFLPNIYYESMNWETVDAIIAQGIGVGFVPDVLVRKNRQERSRYRRIASENAVRDYVLLTRREPVLSPVIRQFYADLPHIFI